MGETANDNACLITLRATPLGHVNADWVIPLAILPATNQFVMPLIKFKYVISEVLKVPLPLSDKAVEVLNEVIKCKMVNATGDVVLAVPWREETDLSLNKTILISLLEDKGLFTALRLRFVSKNLVNNDGIFFKVVYPVINTLADSLKVKIDFTAHFSYGIRKFRFYYLCFNSVTSEMLKRKVNFDVGIKQDIIKAYSVFFILEKGEQVDMHIQASRLPFILKKDFFWVIVSVLAVLLLLLPAINFIRSLF